MNQLEVVWSIEKYIMNTTIFFFSSSWIRMKINKQQN